MYRDDHYNDALYDEWWDSMYEEIKPEAIEEFQSGRLQSYYASEANLILAPRAFLMDARKLLDNRPTAALLYAAIALENGLKSGFLRPIVHGLIHQESVAALLTDMVLRFASLDRYKDLLFQILTDHGGLDLRKHKRERSDKTLWEEVIAVQAARNRVLHRAERSSAEEAELGIVVASEVIEKLFPEVVRNVGLHVHDDSVVCADYNCRMREELAARKAEREAQS